MTVVHLSCVLSSQARALQWHVMCVACSAAWAAVVMTDADQKALYLQAPSGVSKFDPLPHAMRIEAPSGRSQSDPFAKLIKFFHTRTSAKVCIEKLIIWAQDQNCGQMSCGSHCVEHRQGR